MAAPLLFTPLSLKSVSLKNRVVVAPMHQYAALEGHATDWHLVNAGRYAQGGAGLVIMESTKIARNGCGTVMMSVCGTTSSSRRWRDAHSSSRHTVPLPAFNSAIPAARRACGVHGKAARR